MMKALLGIFGVLTLPGCMLFSYDLTPPHSAPQSSTARIGRDCGLVLFGLGYGDLSVAEAMKRGHITTPHTIRVSENYVLLAGENCVIVEGEGDPIATPRPESETGTGFDYRQRK